jgi:GTP-dependent dephospho-CoA kinase
MPIKPKDFLLLKRPFGTLIPDEQVTRQKISSLLAGSEQVITVGDATTERLVSFGIIPDVAVIDGKERRLKRKHTADYRAQEFHCINPAGTISQDAMNALESVLKTSPPVRLLVDGEEDMLALPVFVMALEGSSVLYGQPLEGLVAVKITRVKQKQAKDLMERICDNTNLISASGNHKDEDVAQAKKQQKSHTGSRTAGRQRPSKEH